MSGNFVNPHALTSGAGYKANPTYDEFLRKHSGFYRRHSNASNALEEDRRRSSINQEALAAAQANVAAEEGASGSGRRKSSIAFAGAGAATANVRKGSVVVASSVDRKDSIFGLEATAGTTMDPGRRPSTSLASDLFHKMKGDSRKNSASA